MRALRPPLALLSAVALATPALAGAGELLRVSGTGTALGTMRRLAAAFQKASPGYELKTLPSVGSGGAFRAVATGALELGISARQLRAEEVGLGLVALPYARTPFLFAAGPRCGVKDITYADAVRMYRGELTAWPNGERVRLVLRPRADADTHILMEISDELAAAAEVAHVREGMLMAVTNQECNEVLG